MKSYAKLIMSLLAVVCTAAISASAQQLASRASHVTMLPLTVTSTITTLYANDPIAHSLCFTDGKEGGVFQNGEPRNRCSHIEFDAYKSGNLSVGIEGAEVGQIIDLGTEDDLSKQYGYQQTVGKGEGFASIEFRDGKLLIVKDRKPATRQELAQATQLFGNGQSVASAEARAGHIYLAHITDRYNKNFEILVKLLVLSARPGESVTFRWELL
jgi:hypothetical protein